MTTNRDNYITDLFKTCRWLEDDLNRLEGGKSDPENEGRNMICHVGLLRGRQLDAKTEGVKLLDLAMMQHMQNMKLLNDIRDHLRENAQLIDSVTARHPNAEYKMLETFFGERPDC